MLEGLLRHCDDHLVKQADVQHLAAWKTVEEKRAALQFIPGRVVLQDFTGVPVVVDLASMRSAMKELGGDPARINPTVPVDLVIDHSVQVDYYGLPDAFQRNAELEFERNKERYELLHWAQKAFKNLRVVPPATGIVHQVNLEFLARLVLTREEDGQVVAFPDTLVGTDSHTTMINGLGVVGWGVGGIEAIAAMLSQPIEILTPDVIGVRLTGRLNEGVTPTDLTLTITQVLRKRKVVDKFVEFFGDGLDSLSLADRAMIANMSPENGATITYFPVDEQTLAYLRQTGRPEELVQLVEAYYRRQHLFRSPETPDPEYTEVLELDLSTVEPSMAGPRRPQDRVTLSQVKDNFRQLLPRPKNEGGFGVPEEKLDQQVKVELNGQSAEMGHGAIAIASITSCTNTSNPFGMITAGLLAKKAVERGLRVKPYVKTSMAPGSRVVTDYLQASGLMEPLAELGFDVVGYGCMVCIGNSGPLPIQVQQAIEGYNLVATAVLSGNRNFEGRIHSHAAANYLASPPLVIAYALAGDIDVDLTQEPLGYDAEGQPVFLREIWPSSAEVQEMISRSISAELFKQNYANVFTGNETWNEISSEPSELFEWNPQSTYVQEPPYFKSMGAKRNQRIENARVLAVLGDSITTDHISPAGSISAKSPAGMYLLANAVEEKDFNSYGSRRGNDRIMTRGTFANIRLKNQLVPGVEGGYTVHLPDNEVMSIHSASLLYAGEGVPLIILAGKEYGSGSSRDWAAKGPLLLGVRAVIAESFERIHRSNLVGMGILPLQFAPGHSAASIGLTGKETFTIEGLPENLGMGTTLTVVAVREDGVELRFPVTVRINTEIELEYYRNGGIMQTVLLNMLNQAQPAA
jgi:aconitate hydratase